MLRVVNNLRWEQRRIIIIVGLNLQVCFYQLLHDGCDLYWEYSNIIKYQYQTFILCQFLIQPLWTKRYLPVSQEAWTLTPDDEFYFHLSRLFYRTDAGKTHKGLRGCLMHLVNLREARPTSSLSPEGIVRFLKSSTNIWINGWLVCWRALWYVFCSSLCYRCEMVITFTNPPTFWFILSNTAHSGSLNFIFNE